MLQLLIVTSLDGKLLAMIPVRCNVSASKISTTLITSGWFQCAKSVGQVLISPNKYVRPLQTYTFMD